MLPELVRQNCNALSIQIVYQTRKPWFQYLQLQSFFSYFFRLSPLRSTLSNFELLLKNSASFPKRTLSILYKILLQAIESPLPSYTELWSQDLQVSLDLNDWSQIWNSPCNLARAIPIKIQYFKLLSHWYLTPLRLHHMFPSSFPFLLEAVWFNS